VFTLAGQLRSSTMARSFPATSPRRARPQDLHQARTGARDQRDHALQPPAEHGGHKIAPAIATNNCMVCKPTELTPLTAITLADILYEAGLPPEMFQIVTGWPKDIGDEMITNEHIDIITFTGGVPVGKMIAEKAGYKRTALELGGNDPLIILQRSGRCDDLDKAATIAVAGATGNSGQRCTAVKRILVQESVADAFVPLVLRRRRRSASATRWIRKPSWAA
jgi:acyl-CoA reductase-like NAD-dependent aldehyde dehydrogenase